MKKGTSPKNQRIRAFHLTDKLKNGADFPTQSWRRNSQFGGTATVTPDKIMNGGGCSTRAVSQLKSVSPTTLNENYEAETTGS